MKYYYLSLHSEIEAKEIEKVTDKFVFWKGGRREALTSSYHCFRPTPEQCKQWLIDVHTSRVDDLKLQLTYVEEQLSKAKSLSLPND